jgi:tetratricopeptide (TPR) repeat protein
VIDRLTVLAVAVSMAACSAFRGPLTPPELGGSPWAEITSPHFLLKTDAAPSRAREVLADLEQSYAALAYVMQRAPREAESAVEVVLFGRDRDFFEVAGQARTMNAYMTTGLAADLERRPVVVMYASEVLEEARRTVQHELTHRFLHERYPSLPTWLDEGLAQYYSSLRVDGGRLVVGAFASVDFSDRPYFWLASKVGFEQTQIPVHLAPTAWQLVHGERVDFYTSGDVDGVSDKDRERASAHYGGAWRLVHLLMNGPNAGDRARFQSFLGDLQRGERAQLSFLERFGNDWPGLERQYRSYLMEQRIQTAVSAYPPPAPAPPAAPRAMSVAEVHLLWARLLRWDKAGLPRVRSELDAALAADGASPEVRLGRAMYFFHQKDLEAARRELEVALVTAPEDPRTLLGAMAWFQERGAASPATPGAVDEAPRAALVERLARTARSASQMNAVAWYYATHHRANDGLPFSLRSLRVDPLCWSCQDTYAVILLARGEADQAFAAIERAISLVPEGTSAPLLLEHRRAIENARAARARPLP